MKDCRKVCSLLLSLLLFVPPLWAGLEDFDVSNSKIDLQELFSGGPAKDGIPALTQPKFVSAAEASFLKADDRIVGVTFNDQAKAYPLGILNWHEIVNDEVGGQPLAVTFCPLTKSAVVFDRRLAGQVLEFGVSGLLYNSNVVMYDRTTNSLWSQLKMKGLTGKMATRQLQEFPAVVTSWSQWKQQHPDTWVLSSKTGHWRDYDRDPYSGYHTSREIMFPVNNYDSRLNNKDLVIGIRIKDQVKAYPLQLLQQSGKAIQDKVAGVDIRVHPLHNGLAFITDASGKTLPATVVYWFAWNAFYPNTLVYSQ